MTRVLAIAILVSSPMALAEPEAGGCPVAPADPAHAQPAAAPAQPAAAPAVMAQPAPAAVPQAPGAVGWYFAPTTGFTTFGGDGAFLLGARTALFVHRTIGVGLAGTFLATDKAGLTRDSQPRNVGSYGGLYFQYVLQDERSVHAYLDATVGAGEFCSKPGLGRCDGQSFTFAEPTANVEANLGKAVKVSAGVGYRFAGAGSGELTSGEMSGIVVRTSLSVGAF
jgi:hypothetical protein